MHPFTPKGSGASLPTKKDMQQASSSGGTRSHEGSPGTPLIKTRKGEGVDLALRVALLKAGIITQEQIAAAEKDIEAGGIIFIAPGGPSADHVDPGSGSPGSAEGGVRGGSEADGESPPRLPFAEYG